MDAIIPTSKTNVRAFMFNPFSYFNLFQFDETLRAVRRSNVAQRAARTANSS